MLIARHFPFFIEKDKNHLFLLKKIKIIQQNKKICIFYTTGAKKLRTKDLDLNVKSVTSSSV